MQHLFQSPFLQALGYAIANSLWQAALVWLVFVLLNSVLRLNAANRYKLAVASQLLILVWFLVTLQFYTTLCNNMAAQVPSNTDRWQQVMLNKDSSIPSLFIAALTKGEQWLPYLSVAYLVLMCFLCIRWVIGYRKTQLIRSTGLSKMPAQWRIFTSDLALQLGIKRKVQVFLSETIHTPLTIGFLKPLILIPVASINHLSAEQLEAVILHEMAHIKRYDYLLNIILSIVEISLFFNPFTQLLSKQIRKERENSCDDWVLQFQYNAASYAEALLQIARLQTVPAAFAMAAANPKHDLLGRIKRMIDPQENRFNYRRQVLAFGMVTLLLASIAWFNPNKGFTQSSTGSKAFVKAPQAPLQPIAAEPVAIQVNNPLFNPVFFLSEPLKKKIRKDMEAAALEIQSSSKEVVAVAPVVSAALETAAQQLNQQLQLSNIQQEAASREMAKAASWTKQINNVVDTAAIFASIRNIPKKEELDRTFRKMKEDIEKARKDLCIQLSQQEEKFSQSPEAAKMQHEMALALKELEKLNLDKLVSVTLQQIKIPEIIFASDKNRKEKQVILKDKAADNKSSTAIIMEDL